MKKNMTFKLDSIEKYISNSSDGSNRIRLKCKLIWTMLHSTGGDAHSRNNWKKKSQFVFIFSICCGVVFYFVFIAKSNDMHVLNVEAFNKYCLFRSKFL